MNTITKEIERFCERIGITPAQFSGEVPIKGTLTIEDDVTIPPGFRPRVMGTLTLLGPAIFPTGFAPVVSGSLHLINVTKVGDGFAPVVGKSLWLNEAITVGDGFAPIVGGNLYLNQTMRIGDGFAPIVGDNLYLNSRLTLPAGCAPRVKGLILLKGEAFNGWVLTGLGFKAVNRFKLIEGQGGKYIIADDLLMEVVSRRGNVQKVKCIASDEVFYLVTDGSGNFAHGHTLAEARESLMYKISDRDMSEYEKLSQDSELTFADAIKMYRSITGACAAGTQHFVESNEIEKKNYTIREIINMTAGQYGHEQLVKFFRA